MAVETDIKTPPTLEEVAELFKHIAEMAKPDLRKDPEGAILHTYAKLFWNSRNQGKPDGVMFRADKDMWLVAHPASEGSEGAKQKGWIVLRHGSDFAVLRGPKKNCLFVSLDEPEFPWHDSAPIPPVCLSVFKGELRLSVQKEIPLPECSDVTAFLRILEDEITAALF